MAQNCNVLARIHRFTRVDFAALRARLNNIDTATIYHRYYDEDTLEDIGCHSVGDLDDRLEDMCANLAKRAERANPHIAVALADARSSNRWAKPIVDFLVASAEKDLTNPQPSDSVAVWFKKRVTRVLKEAGIHTLQDLLHFIELRGSNWYRPIQRLGPGKASSIVAWLRSFEKSLGPLVLEPLRPVANQVVLQSASQLVPLERISALAMELDGRQGLNRNNAFCLISARNDLEAVLAYLYRFKDQGKTYRAYEKELTRFLLWCVTRRGIPLSSVLTAECEAYKDFLANPAPDWIGVPATPRSSPRWRPFVGQLSPQSQRYAVQAIRSFFEWLVRVRYLHGNPWITVHDPLVATKELTIDIDKALPEKLWIALTETGGILDRVCEAYPYLNRPAESYAVSSVEIRGAQYRLARAAILLMGMTGLRREEAVSATRDKLKAIQEKHGRLWELAVLGKRMKWRTVLLPRPVIDALLAHWEDRRDAWNPASSKALLSPVVVPRTRAAYAKHVGTIDARQAAVAKGFSPDGLYRLVKTALCRMADDDSLPLSPDDRSILMASAPHALRHTFATHAAAHEVEIDTLQRLMGHATQQTTSIYIRAERTRSIEQISKLYGVDER